MSDKRICDACETVAHCQKHGCIPVRHAALSTAAPAAPADDFWPVDGKASRKQLIEQIGQMNFRLTALRQENAGLIKRVQGQASELRRAHAAPQAQQPGGSSDFEKAVQVLGYTLAREHAVYLTRDSARKLLTSALAARAGAQAVPSDAEIDALLDAPATLAWHVADDNRARMRLWTRLVLARWGAPAAVSEQAIEEWARRHQVDHVLRGSYARAAFEDAQSLHLDPAMLAAAPQAPAQEGGAA